MNGESCIGALKALGERSRVRVLRLLYKEPLGVNQIAGRLKLSQYNVSKHLRVLREAGLVDVRQDGKQRLYSVRQNLKTSMASSGNVLDLGCCSFQMDKLPG